MSESFSIPTTGDEIAGKYRVMEELGRGAYGVVFRAEQIGLDRSVALKTLLPQAFLQVDIVQRFHREAQLISRLDHENVIKLYDYGVDEGLLYMAVEYVEGRTLADVLRDEAPVPPSKVRELINQILDALDYAHGEGIVHRDLKPDNILLLKSNPLEGIVEEVVKILDFGIAKLQQDEQGEGALKTLTQDGTVLGTPHYMSPENIVGDEVDHRADLYAVGVIIYELLVGEHPFEAPSPSAVMVRHLRDEPPHLPGAYRGSAFDLAVQACLEKQPLDRVESAKKIREILDSNPVPADQAGLAAVENAQDTEHEDSPGTKSKKAVSAAAIFFMLLILAVSVGWKVWYVAQEHDSESIATVEDVPADPIPTPPAVDGGSARGMVAQVEEPSGFDFDEDTGLNLAEPDVSEPAPEEIAAEAKPRPREKKEPRKEEVEKITIVVKSNPTHASVSIDGIPVGNTPVHHEVPISDDEVKIRVSLLGYKNETFTVAAKKDTEVNARLQFDRIKMFD